MSEWMIERLSRGPIRVDDSTEEAKLEAELGERLEALLAAHMLEPTADGWRALALALACEHEPSFAVETPVDRSSLGGRPTNGYGNFILRSLMKQEMRADAGPERGAQSRAAKVVAKKYGVAVGTANNAMSRKGSTPDSVRRAPYLRKAERALSAAARKMSQQ